MDLFEIKTAMAHGKAIYDLPLRVTYYARVSTDKDEQAHSLKAQIQYYEDFIRSVGPWIFVPGYIDEGFSGTSVLKRGAFLRMVEDAKQKKFDYIITKEISRFSRSTLDSIRYTQALLKSGVGVYFQSDNINTLSPDAELRLTIMSSIAQDEVRKTSERVRFGHRRSIEKGVVLGNSSIWGYQKQNGRLVIVEKEARMVREIFDLYANGRLGVRRVCDELGRRGYKNSNGNPFSFTTIRNIIANPKYKGYYCGGKSTKIDYRLNERRRIDPENWVQYFDAENVPPIVSEEIWERANRILNKRSAQMSAADKTSYSNKYAYSGKIWCAEHGEPYYRGLYRYSSGNKEVWQCRRFVEQGAAGCGSPIVYTAELDEILRQCYHAILQEKSAIIHKLAQIYSSIAESSDLQQDMAKAQKEMDAIAARKDRLLDLSVEGRVSGDEFERRNNAFNADIERLATELASLKEQAEKNRELCYSAEGLRKMVADELDLSGGLTNAVAETLLEKIEVFKTGSKGQVNLKIYFKLMPGAENFCITRRRGKASVCLRQHI